MLKTVVVLIVMAIAMLPAPAAAQSTHLLIVVGLAGDPEHGELFQKWATTLADTASGRLGVAREHVTLVAGDRATRDEGTRAFGALVSSAAEDDPVMIVLFGHGTFANKVAKFNLKGPDMTPEDFAALLKRLRSKRVVFVDTASASGPFVESLSGAGRVIISATRTGAEQYATLFGGPFVEAFGTEAADADRNGRVSVLEAFDYARRQVAAAYQREGLMQTEHALLDDNGDREGSLQPGPQAKDGQSAAVLSLGSTHHEAAPANEQLRALYAERQALEQRIDALKLLQSGMEPDKYAAELEKLATELAVKSRQIREVEGGK